MIVAGFGVTGVIGNVPGMSGEGEGILFVGAPYSSETSEEAARGAEG